MICPAETPEGAACGLVKNLALMAQVSVGTNAKQLASIIEDHSLDSLSEIITRSHSNRGKFTKIFLNGNWIGNHQNADDLLDRFKKLRRTS